MRVLLARTEEPRELDIDFGEHLPTVLALALAAKACDTAQLMRHSAVAEPTAFVCGKVRTGGGMLYGCVHAHG